MATATQAPWSFAGMKATPTGAEYWSGYRPDTGRAVFAKVRANAARNQFVLVNQENKHRHEITLFNGVATCSCEARGECWHKALVLFAAEHLPDEPHVPERRLCPACNRREVGPEGYCDPCHTWANGWE